MSRNSAVNFVRPARITPSVRVVIFGPAHAEVAAYLGRGFLVPGPQGDESLESAYYAKQSCAIAAAVRSPMTADEAARSAGFAVDPQMLNPPAAPRAHSHDGQAWYVPVTAATTQMAAELDTLDAEYVFAVRSSENVGARPIADDELISYAVAVVLDTPRVDTAALAARFPHARWVKALDRIVPGEDFAPRTPVFADTRELLFARAVLSDFNHGAMDGFPPRLLISSEEVAGMLARCGLDARNVPAAARAALRTAAYAYVLSSGAVVTNATRFLGGLTGTFAQAGHFATALRAAGVEPEGRPWRTRWGATIWDNEATALFNVAANVPNTTARTRAAIACLRAFGFITPARRPSPPGARMPLERPTPPPGAFAPAA